MAYIKKHHLKKKITVIKGISRTSQLEQYALKILEQHYIKTNENDFKVIIAILPIKN